jgi:YebC/PmpR family DNA-binding regulatory protein
MVLEGYGPGGVAIMIRALSDNRNRTLQDTRRIFSRHGGNLGENGCVSWLFAFRGIITVETSNLDAETLALEAIDAGAEDVGIENSYVEIYTKPDEVETVRAALEGKNVLVASVELSMVPKTTVALEEKTTLQTLKLLDKLEEMDEVQHVSSNADFSDSILEKHQARV